MGNARILVVEDDRDNMGLISFILKREGYSVLEAYNGREGVQRARQDLPNLIILDLAMPEMDGWTAASELKSDPTTQHIPILVLTVRSLAEDRRRAMEAGCDGYFTKPINVPLLMEQIASYLEKAGNT